MKSGVSSAANRIASNKKNQNQLVLFVLTQPVLEVVHIVSNFQLLWLQLPNCNCVPFTAFISECRMNQALPGLAISHCSLIHSFFISNLSSSLPFILLHLSLPVPSKGACWGRPLSQNKHTTPDSISPGQQLCTNFLLIDLHPSLSFSFHPSCLLSPSSPPPLYL